ncbi:hypothetical protein AAVH_28533 [Aphelenchoides avenae]|nr:hypothetical protein AAVH_28533 [Aphelenchus avenae]
MPLHNEILTVRATCLNVPAENQPDIEFICACDTFRDYPPSNGFTGFKVNKKKFVEADGGKWPTLNNSYLLRVQFYQNPQAGIPQAIVLKVTDLGVQRPLLYSCHLYEYADGRQNDENWCKGGATGPIVVTDGCRRPEVRLPPKGREWEVRGLQPGSNKYNKAINLMWLEQEEFGDGEMLL